jgi:hypothetical protein
MKGLTMKGIVFSEFLELVDEEFSMETCEQVLEMSDLPSGGVYTSIGTYDPQEMRTLLGNLHEVTGVPVPDLLQTFGRHLFGFFVTSFPMFFEGVHSTFAFLPRVHSYVHLEVRKLYPDASLPTFACEEPADGVMVMSYRSQNDLPDLAHGLIQGCIEHYGEALRCSMERVGGEPPETVFTIAPI